MLIKHGLGRRQGFFWMLIEDFGDILGPSEVSLGVSWRPLGGSGSVLGAYSGRSVQKRFPTFPKERHRCPPKVAKGAQEAPRWPPKGRQELFNEAPKAMKISYKDT